MRQHRRPMGWRVRHDDRILVAHDLTKPARHALFRNDLRHLVMARTRVRRIFLHVNAVERTDIDTKLTTRAIVHDDLRLWDLAGLDARDEVAVLILNAGDRAIDRTHPTVDATFGVNHIQLFRPAADRVNRTLQLTDSAADAGVRNEIRHAFSLFLIPNPTRPTLRKFSQGL